ncbi:hypothetical protein LAZ67_1001480 [Cordylochernes scorpioides]|uniref:HTH psq-type domain-containing protein n=1 Tax=Cordylochernes scorpioides TaxID=51811 RepID=A0ABY6JVF8_9ARAC|nr:hypothetical protein LAZ67_1001480 [Cordylochernes scorpioides]
MDRKKVCKKSSAKKKMMSIELKREIIEKHEQGVRVVDLSRQYGRSTSMICSVLKRKESIKSVTPAKGLTIISKLRTSLHENMEILLMVWVTEKQLQGDTLTQKKMCESEKNVAKKAKTKSSEEIAQDFTMENSVTEMEENRLPKLCWNRLKEISLMTKKPIGFCKNIMDIINHCGLTRLNLGLNYDDIRIELPNILKIKIEQLLQQDLAKLSLTKTYSNYRLLYDSFIPEHYFSCNLSSALVSFIAQIRIISTLIKENHIYVIKKEDLYCKLCGGQITDEIYHFTAECGDLEGERKKILKSLPRPHLNSLKTIKTVSDKKSWAIELFNYQKSVVNKIALVEERRTGAQ